MLIFEILQYKRRKEKSPQEIISELLRERGVGWLLPLISQSEINQLVKEVAKTRSMESVAAQTDFDNESIQDLTNVRESVLLVEQGIQYEFLEKSAIVSKATMTDCVQTANCGIEANFENFENSEQNGSIFAGPRNSRSTRAVSCQTISLNRSWRF